MDDKELKSKILDAVYLLIMGLQEVHDYKFVEAVLDAVRDADSFTISALRYDTI